MYPGEQLLLLRLPRPVQLLPAADPGAAQQAGGRVRPGPARPRQPRPRLLHPALPAVTLQQQKQNLPLQETDRCQILGPRSRHLPPSPPRRILHDIIVTVEMLYLLPTICSVLPNIRLSP